MKGRKLDIFIGVLIFKNNGAYISGAFVIENYKNIYYTNNENTFICDNYFMCVIYFFN